MGGGTRSANVKGTAKNPNPKAKNLSTGRSASRGGNAATIGRSLGFVAKTKAAQVARAARPAKVKAGG